MCLSSLSHCHLFSPKFSGHSPNTISPLQLTYTRGHGPSMIASIFFYTTSPSTICSQPSAVHAPLTPWTDLIPRSLSPVHHQILQSLIIQFYFLLCPKKSDLSSQFSFEIQLTVCEHTFVWL